MSGDYTWPVRVIQLFLVQIYLFAGYTKIVIVGWKWASASDIRAWFLYFTEEDQVRVSHSLGEWVADRPILCLGVGVTTLIFELGLITVLFSKVARCVLAALVAVCHLAILLSLNLTFLNVRQLLVFADWDVVAAWKRLTGPTREPTRMVGINSPT
jgi:hypothetical protein